MSDEKPELAALINWPTLVTSLLGAAILGLFATWSAQQGLAADLERVEAKLDDVIEVIEEVHPRRSTP